MAAIPKSMSVFLALRDEIIRGDFHRGQQLPTFDDLEARFGVSRTVIQQAVWRLRGEGFVHSVNRQGLYVTDSPPHLNRYALVFSDVPGDSSWTRFNTAIINEARRLEAAGYDCEIVPFIGVAEDNSTTLGYQKLRKEVESHRLAGLVLMPHAYAWAKQAPFNDDSLPKVFTLCSKWEKQQMVVGVDSNGFLSRAFDWLKSCGRRRVAIIKMADTFGLLQAADVCKVGLECHPSWIQTVGRSHPAVVRQLSPLLLDYPADQRPDGLIIADDNLAEHALAGLVDTGIRVGTDIDVVAHCNWPWPVPSIIPVKRLGFHAGDLLARCISIINSHHRGETFEACQFVPALFEDEALSDINKAQERALPRTETVEVAETTADGAAAGRNAAG